MSGSGEGGSICGVKQVDPAARAVLVASLRARQAAGERVTAAVAGAAAMLGVAEGTVWRWLRENPPSQRRPQPRYVLTEADRDAFLDWRGNVAAVHRARVAAGGTGVPSRRALHRAFLRELTPGERAAARSGVEGRRRHEVYLRWEPVCRNARWETDHKELPVQVIAPGRTLPVKPWVTLFLDCYSRLIMGWAVALRPDAAVVLAALRRGLVVDPDRGPFGGVPAVLVPDGGLEFAATALARVCATLDVALAPTAPYTPTGKGKVERVNRTVDQLLLAGLPFYTEGPRAADGRLFGPGAGPMGLELFVDRFAAWVSDYNTVRPHSGLGGQTPLQRWCEDSTPIREIAPEQLRWLLLADAERVINRDGIHFGGVIFIAGELNGRVGDRVQIRYTPHDLRRIEVFTGDTWLCTALPQGLLSPEQRADVLARRRADAAELGRRQRAASRRARAKLAPITAPGPTEETTVITTDTQRAETHPRRRALVDTETRDRDLAREARTDLLDLHRDFDYWNPPDPDTATPSCATPSSGEVSAEGGSR